ncbi:MAG: imidazoleglycerol-phosphate dehydratase HisB [Atopobiaceae bacterium]|nr:imidazoleglycerol-phosphate dehydratase HisB [Atopobiaceae bacterium]
MSRIAKITRTTSETDIVIKLDLDGTGQVNVETGVPFFNHMMNALGRHGLLNLEVQAQGDIEIDAHHTVEDTGIVLGQAIKQALGDKAGISRFADVVIPMDETLVMAAIDISGRGELFWDVEIGPERVGTFDTELGQEFFCGLAREAGITLHIRKIAGSNAHHILEACFKAFGRALRFACEPDARVQGVPSTKGCL